jgi:hypothetical protein
VIDKSKRKDGTFSREDFTFNKERNIYICPAGKILTTTGKLVNDGETILFQIGTWICCTLHSHGVTWPSCATAALPG